VDVQKGDKMNRRWFVFMLVAVIIISIIIIVTVNFEIIKTCQIPDFLKGIWAGVGVAMLGHFYAKFKK